MQPLEPECDDVWIPYNAQFNISGATLSGAVSARSVVVDRSRHSGFRLYVNYSLNASTSVTAIVVSAESVPPTPEFISSAGAPLFTFAGKEMYQAVPTSGAIKLHPLVFNRDTTSGASALEAFWVPATPLQGQFTRITIGVNGTPHGSDAIQAVLGLCYV